MCHELREKPHSLVLLFASLMESILLQAFLLVVLKSLVAVAGFLHVTTDHP